MKGRAKGQGKVKGQAKGKGKGKGEEGQESIQFQTKLFLFDVACLCSEMMVFEAIQKTEDSKRYYGLICGPEAKMIIK